MEKFLLLCFLFLVSILPGLSQENGWVLTQYSKAFGNQYVYLNPNGVRCVNPRQGIGWMSQGPAWNITFFNDKTKVYYPLSNQHWKEKMAKQGLTSSSVSWALISTGSIAGTRASQYKISNATGANAKWSAATYWLADDIKVPQSLAQLISSTCGMPASNSIPLQMNYRDKNGQTVTLLQTYHQQQAKIPDQYFYLPTDYKLAKSEVEVLISQENRAMLNDLADDLKSGKSISINKSANGSNNTATGKLSLDKLPDQIALPNGKTVTKGQISKFLNGLK